MFSSLSDRLSSVFAKLRKRGVLSEEDVQNSLREIRIALLEADVALPVIKDFIERIKEKAVGQGVIKSIQPAQMMVKIVHDELIHLLGESLELNTSARSPFAYLMVGLQGSGKTTSTAKLALYLKKLKKTCFLVSLDIYRPAAQKQLEILAHQWQLNALPIVEGEKPLQIVERAFAEAKKLGVDVILFDTAGRLHIDDVLMQELREVREKVQPLETLLVADSLMGQDAVRMAQTFHNEMALTGIILTRVDGDSRGGAALSMRHVTGAPIKFMGMGEKVDQFEVFDPTRLADRILDMGDIVSLVEKASQSFQEEDMEKMAAQFEKGNFTLQDMAHYLESMQKMGGLSSLLNFFPGAGRLKGMMQEKGIDDQTSDRLVRRQVALIYSMTRKERLNPKILNSSRRKRIASGSGQRVEDVNRLIKQFQQMQTMMKQLKGGKGMLRGGLSRLFKM